MSREPFKRQRKFSPSGDRFRVNYIVDRSKPVPCLCEVGRYDFDELINSYREEAIVTNVIKKATQGDLEALHRVQGLYLDTSGMAEDPTLAHKARLDLGRYFMSLPMNVRGHFTSFGDFLSQMQLDMVTGASSHQEESEVKKDESSAE